MFNNVLLVCAGDICSSPVGEMLLQKHLPALAINSAGISALTGNPADTRPMDMTQERINKHTLLLVIEKMHIKAVTDEKGQNQISCTICPPSRSISTLSPKSRSF